MEYTTAPPPPPPPPPWSPPPPPARGGSRWPVWVVGGLAVVALITAAVLVAGSSDDGPSAEETLSRAQDAMLDAGTFRLHSEATDRTSDGEAGSGGSDFSFRVVTEAEVAGADWRATADEGDLLDEAVAIDGDVYARSEEDEAALAAAAWTVVPSAPMRDADIVDFLFFDVGG